MIVVFAVIIDASVLLKCVGLILKITERDRQYPPDNK